jgi:Suppressor of fused protein (SUFU)
MPDLPQTKNGEWQKIWDARIAALTPILGKPTDKVLHAVIPFQLGGSADVLPFPDFTPGITYVTAEMTGEDVGQRPTTLGNYELMICARQELQKAGDLISKLARYTCDAELEPGETMDIGTFFGDSTIRALLFTYPREVPVHFEFLGQRCGLLLCIGITSEELAFKKAHGSANLLALLRQHGVFPYTVPERPSVPLARGGSFFGKLFGR